MELEKDTNYIVSGLERSGTSLVMQLLSAGNVPIAFDESRPPDEHNPKGYYELEGGKIINKLMEGTFPLEKYTGKFLKITAYGLKFLPSGNYKIIYSERNIEEILDSMETMVGGIDFERNKTKESFVKLNTMIKQIIINRTDISVLFVNYNEILSKPETSIFSMYNFIGITNIDAAKIAKAIDKKLYRQRRGYAK